MRRAGYLSVVLCFVATAAPAQEPAKPSLTGSLALTGALSGTFSWKPDLALNCICILQARPPVGVAHVTMTDGAGVFIAVQASADGELKLTSGKLKGLLRGKGKSGTCAAIGPSALAGKLTLPIDATVADKGETVTVKGSLVATCP